MEEKNKRGGKRPGAGRPLSTHKKSKTYTISLYPEELEKLKKIASSNDLTVSQLLRNTFNL